MQRGDRCGAERFEHEIAIGDCIDAVGGGAVKAQRRRETGAVDWVRRARQCAAAEWALIGALAGVGESRRVALEHFNVRQTPVREEDRLGALQRRGNGEWPPWIR